MTLCLCRRHLMLGATAGLLPGVGRAQLAASDHATLYAALRQADALDPYVNRGLDGIAVAVAGAMRVPGGAAVNRVPAAGGVMVCVLRAERERPPLPAALAVPAGLTGSPVTDPERRVIWIDADFLRILAMRISLRAKPDWGGAGLTAPAAVAQSLLTPPPALPQLWQESTSPALRHPLLLLESRGAGGFLLAHEMGHVLLGTPPSLDVALSGLPRRARQLAPMCPDLTNPSVIARRTYEERADALALEGVLNAGDAVGRPPTGLPGEFGIAMLFVLMLSADVVRVGSTVDAPLPQRYLELVVGHDAFVHLREQFAPRPGTDLVHLFYTDTHPAAVQRLLAVMRSLAARPGSMWYGSGDPVSDQMLLQRLVEEGCREAMHSMPRQ
ncbi:MAG TPA: hypothetical protein VME92_00620 [Acetobacteraceae bacterium]|nr:hypothetical protein [Acetobacteraceae bacterium]